MDKNLKLWYQQPAGEWTDSLPLGNGRIGAMVFGGIEKERIALNEDTLWSGYPRDTNHYGASGYLEEARKLSRERKFEELEKLIEEHMLGDYTESYLPLGDIFLSFPNIEEEKTEEYYRDLLLDEAVAHTGYTCEGIHYRREAFVSHPAQAFFMRISADRSKAVSVEAEIASPLRSEVCAEENTLILRGICPSHVEPSYLESETPVIYEEEEEKKGIAFEGILHISCTGGQIRCENQRIIVTDADEVLLVFAVRTSFNGFMKLPYLEGKEYHKAVVKDLEKIACRKYEELKQEHIRDYQALYERVGFSLTDGEEDLLPTDERLRNFAQTQTDLHLYELIFQYGRYLMIASSRENTQPSNLQGIWNAEFRAPWSSNYTLNINTEMNYWPAESCNLSELHEPLFRMVEELRMTGRKTAEVHYGKNGVAVHHNTDIWRLSNPVGRQNRGTVGYAYWCMSFGWLCRHMFEHYEYTLDREFLENRAYPAIRDAAVFFLEMLTEEENGYLILSPSTSPENTFRYQGKESRIARTTTMTTAIIKEVFRNACACQKILGIDRELGQELEACLRKLIPYQTGADGRLMEWYEEYEDVEVTHRHISHLYPLYPGNEITPDQTPELARACEKSLLVRGDDGTGWSLGWKINAWARLGDGEHAYRLLKRQLRFVDTSDTNYSNGGGTYRNLFDAHPPFQIDGNFAAVSGIVQMYVQSMNGRILLLPALPEEWKNSSLRGIRLPGDMQLDLEVKDGLLEKAVISANQTTDRSYTVVYQEKRYELKPEAEKKYELSVCGGHLSCISRS